MQVFGIVGTIIVARIIGPSVLGTIAWAMAFTGLFAPIGNPALNIAHNKLISEGQDLGDCISTYHRLIKITLSALFVVVISTILVMKYVLHYEFESETHFYVLLIMALLATVNKTRLSLAATFSARLELAKVSVPAVIESFAHHLLKIVVVIMGLRAIGLSSVYVLTAGLLVGYYIWAQKDYPRGRYDPILAKKYFGISSIMFVSVIVENLMRTLDKVLLNSFTDSAHVGYYTAGFRIGGFLLLFAGSLGNIFLPLFSKAIAENNLESIRDKINKNERFAFIFIMPAILLLSILSDPIVRLILGSQYLPTIPILALINLTMFLPIINVPYKFVLVGMGRFTNAVSVQVAALGIFLIVSIICSAHQLLNMAGVGLAIGILSLHLFQGIVYRVYAHGKYHIVNSLRNVRYIFFGLGFYFLAREVFNNGYTPGHYLFPLIYSVVFMVFVYSFYFIFRWLDSNDLALLKQVLNVRKLKSYISNEMTGNED